MTKYILQSGGVGNYPEKAQKFMAEVVQGLGNRPKILFCLFPQAREYWEEKIEGYKDFYTTAAPKEVKPEFILAMPDTFTEQIAQCDVLMMTGGDDHLIQYWLRKFEIPNIWASKVVVANSGSSDALVSSFWTCDWREVMDGLGIIPVKFIPHYKSKTYGIDDPRGAINWDKAYSELESYGEDLPIHALEEGDYIVIEQ